MTRQGANEILRHLKMAYSTWYPDSMSEDKARGYIEKFLHDYEPYDDKTVMTAYERYEMGAERPPFLFHIISEINRMREESIRSDYDDKSKNGFDPPTYIDKNGHECVYYKDLGPAGAEFMEKYWGMR